MPGHAQFWDSYLTAADRGQQENIAEAVLTLRILTPSFLKKIRFWEFPGGLVVRLPGFHSCGLGSGPGRGTEIPQVTWHSKNKKIKMYKSESLSTYQETLLHA